MNPDEVFAISNRKYDKRPEANAEYEQIKSKEKEIKKIIDTNAQIYKRLTTTDLRVNIYNTKGLNECVALRETVNNIKEYNGFNIEYSETFDNYIIYGIHRCSVNIRWDNN